MKAQKANAVTSGIGEASKQLNPIAVAAMQTATLHHIFSSGLSPFSALIRRKA